MCCVCSVPTDAVTAEGRGGCDGGRGGGFAVKKAWVDMAAQGDDKLFQKNSGGRERPLN